MSRCARSYEQSIFVDPARLHFPTGPTFALDLADMGKQLALH
jgi:hypothetical protein